MHHVGYQDLKGVFVGRVWYPTRIDQEEAIIPTRKIFKNFKGQSNAPLISEPQKLPLLLLSHGSGGSFDRLDWMADYFARRGWIVASANHPGNTLGDNSVDGLIQVWRRAQHISTFLGYLLKDPQFKDRIDHRKIAVVGHSAGGTTVLLLAGMRLSKADFQNPIPYCKEMPKDLDDEHCSELKRYDYTKINRHELEKSYRDQRIKAVVAIDPAFERSFRDGPVPTPVLLVLAEHLKDPSGEIFAKEFVEKFPNMQHAIIPSSVHISFVSECSQFGHSIKAPICEGDRHRDQIHLTSNEDIERFLSLNLP